MSDDFDSFDDYEDGDVDTTDDLDDGRDDRSEAKDSPADDRVENTDDSEANDVRVYVDSDDVAAAILNAIDRNADKEGDDGVPVFGDVNSSDSRG